MDNNIYQIQPPQCGIITSSGMITARNSNALIRIMREHNEITKENYKISQRGSTFRVIMSLLCYISFLCFLYCLYMAGRKEEKDKEKEEE